MLTRIPSWIYITAVAIIGVVLIIILAATKEDSLDLAEEDSTQIAERLGADVEQFKKDIVSEEVSKNVEDSKKEGEARGVTGTPTVFINDEKYEGDRSYEALVLFIQGLLDTEIELPITMEVYTDFNCGNCAVFDPIKQQVKQSFPVEQLEVIDRAYPFLKNSSYGYANGLIAAEKQGLGDAFAKEVFTKLHGVTYDNVLSVPETEFETTPVIDSQVSEEETIPAE